MRTIHVRLGLAIAILSLSVMGLSGVAPAGIPVEHYAEHPIHVGPNATAAPTGLYPAAIKAAYGFSARATAGTGQVIAIVDAYDNPNAEADLNVFSAAFGLPLCTTANGCFTKVDRDGDTKYPKFNSGWALEINLDVQWAHAIAPGAHILLVEPKSTASKI